MPPNSDTPAAVLQSLPAYWFPKTKTDWKLFWSVLLKTLNLSNPAALRGLLNIPLWSVFLSETWGQHHSGWHHQTHDPWPGVWGCLPAGEQLLVQHIASSWNRRLVSPLWKHCVCFVLQLQSVIRKILTYFHNFSVLFSMVSGHLHIENPLPSGDFI